MVRIFGASGSHNSNDYSDVGNSPGAVFGTSNLDATAYVGNRRRKAASAARCKPADKQSAFERIVALCSIRDRSSAELRQRLVREGYTEDQVSEAIERSLACALVDDVRFADSLIRNRVRNGKGEVAIRRDLEQHGLAPEQVPGWPDAFGLAHEQQVKRAVAFLETHPPAAKDTYQAAFRKLQARGYSKSVTMQAISLWRQE